jgi:tetratricopeptide (TPR) repeat protein
LNASIAESAVEQAGESFRALRRGITRSRGFSLHVCMCDSPATRDQLIRNLAASMPAVPIHRYELVDTDDDVLEATATVLADVTPGPVMVVGVERVLGDDAHTQRFLSVLNLRRGEWPTRIPYPVVFWLSRRLLGRLTGGAPDFFDWRSDTIEFPELSSVESRPFATREWQFGVSPRVSKEEQQERVKELEARIAAVRQSDDERVIRNRAEWWDELAVLKWVRGDVDEALRIYTEEQIPVYERIGDLRAKAVTQGKIAGILQSRSQLDEAMRIRTEEEIPVFERLGDLRSKAVTWGKIADILKARGQLDEAMRIRTMEQLPVYERLGDVRQKAITKGRIADILQDRGQLDEALRICTEEEVPVYERLGNLHEKAATQSRIADILRTRGQLDEALRLLSDEVLPVFERLGDLRSLLFCRIDIALTLLARGRADDRAQANVLLCLALAAANHLRIPEVGQIEQMLQDVGMACDSMT